MSEGIVSRITRLLSTRAERGQLAAPQPDPEARPYTRWWWFSGPIEADVVESQLGWAQANGFGGVEIAWVYPLQQVVAGPRWLGPDWTEAVAHARRHAEALGLGCDFTFGTLWPFGGSFVPPEDSHHTFDGPSYRPLEQTWESAYEDEPGLVLDQPGPRGPGPVRPGHGGCARPGAGRHTSALFCDSWEVPTRRMWSPKLWDRFRGEGPKW